MHGTRPDVMGHCLGCDQSFFMWLTVEGRAWLTEAGDNWEPLCARCYYDLGKDIER